MQPRLRLVVKRNNTQDNFTSRNNGEPQNNPNLFKDLGSRNYLSPQKGTEKLEWMIATANTLTQEELEVLLKILEDHYHNGDSITSDVKYDQLVQMYESKFGVREVVGSQPREGKVELPYYLGSLKKLKLESELILWQRSYTGPYVLEDKIDGITLLLVSQSAGRSDRRRVTKLFTRGDGFHSNDISHLLEYMTFPPINEDIAVRGELVLTRESFSRVGYGFKNARNLVSGIVNRKNSQDFSLISELAFYAYRILSSTGTPEEDVNKLQSLGFRVPHFSLVDVLTIEQLEERHKERDTNAPYEVDGIVVYQNSYVPYPDGKNPSHILAFKMETFSAATTVITVVWRGSKDMLLKPTVYYEPVSLSGAVLRKATGYNAKFIVTNNIGAGARILVTRSGNTIPKILDVLEGAPEGPHFPSVEYTWNTTRVEFELKNINEEVTVSRLKHFLETLKIKHFGKKRIAAMVATGITTTTNLLEITPEELAKVPGIDTILSTNFCQDLRQAVTNVPLPRLMDASGIFPHIGEKRFTSILALYPDILLLSENNDIEIMSSLISQVAGLDALSSDVAESLPLFVKWLKDHEMVTTAGQRPRQLSTRQQTTRLRLTINSTAQRKLEGMSFVFSGFRDDNLGDFIEEQGGTIAQGVSGKTTMLILKDSNPKSIKGKALNARRRGIPMVTKQDFINEYL